MKSALGGLAAVMLPLVLAAGANAAVTGTYVEAELANTAAVGGGSWATTNDSGTDGLWEYEQSSGHGSWDVFSGRDAVVAYGATESTPMIVTTIGGLTADRNYWLRLVYGSHSTDNHTIRGGLSESALSVYGNTESVAVAGTLYYEGGYMNLHQALLGMAKADSSGEVKAYVATNPSGNNDGRALYDGLSYADAGPGISGTYVEATTANTAAVGGGQWATTNDSQFDGLWQYPQTSGHGSWDIFGNRDAIVAYGGDENTPTLVTTISGLTPGYIYDVRLIFGSQTYDNHSIMAGLALDSLAVFDGSSALAIIGHLEYENGTMNIYQPLLGSIAANAMGEIKVYIAANLAGSKNGRALYDGLSYDFVAVPEPGTLAMLAAGLLGLLAYAWRKRK